VRVILPPLEYRELKDRKYVDQQGRCSDCGDPMCLDEMELHHEAGRGIGGGFRRDTMEDTRGVCHKCHPKADQKKRSKWIVRNSEEQKKV
jgi:hypothetical protein